MENPVEFLYLSQEDVKAAGGLDMKMAIEAVEKAFRMLNAGEVIIPPKIVMVLPPSERDRGRMNALAAYIGGDWEVAGIKWIPSFPKNPQERNLPRASALIILNDTRTGLPLTLMDGTIVSAMRTGAVGGIGAKYLARNDSEIVGLIGMGVQARTQALAMANVLPNIKEFRGFDDRSSKERVKAAEDIERLTGVRTRAVDNPKQAVKEASVIVTATVANEPIVKDDWIKAGNLFIHIGSYIEEEYDVVFHAKKIIVDNWENTKHRKTPILARMFDMGLIKDENIYANLDEIVAGKKLGRETNEERIFFAPIGMAHEDVALAARIYERARREGIGQTLRLWTRPTWI